MEERREPEVWKPIPDYEGIYEVSSWGRVKGLKRLVGYRVKGFFKMLPEKVLTNHIGRGYEFVNLYKENKRDPRRINILVAMVFLEDYDNNKVINHKDQNKLNNYYKNLECVYNRENVTFSVNKNTTSSNYVGAYVSYKIVNGKSYKQIHSEINILGKKIWLGSFKTEEAAHEAYLKALEKHGLTNKYAKKNQE